MKIVWNSVHPEINTGYGTQTAMFTPRIRALGHDVAISAYCGVEGFVSTWNGMTVYPRDLTQFNKYALRKYVKRHADGGDPDDVLVITLQDVWVWLDPKFGGTADYKGLRLASWCPVDHDPVPPPVVDALRAFDSQPIAMSLFGQDRLQKAGFDPFYVPHGVDTKVLHPNHDRDAIREAMGIPKDAFVVGMVANNQGVDLSRKAFTQVLQAFSMFRSRRDDAFLYLHTDMRGLNAGINLVGHVPAFDIPETAFGSVDQERYDMGEIQPEQMSRIFASFDVLINPSLGEGFGIPIVEAQACGTPVIVTDWTSMPELVGAGWLVDGDPFYRPSSGAFWKVPAIGELLEALEMAYQARGDQELRDKARAWALQYDADYVTQEHWKPVLEALDKPREVPPLPLNRAERRRLAKVAA